MSKGTIDLWVAPHTLRWFGNGEHCHDAEAGDVILVRHATSVAWAITAGQKVLTLTQPELKGYTWNDHVAFIVEVDGVLTVSEMGPRGHEYRPLFDYVDRLYCVVNFDVSEESKQRVLDNDEACKDVRYGWWSYPPFVLNGLTGMKFSGDWGSTMICSDEVTRCASGLYVFPDRCSDAVAPAHWSKWVGASLNLATLS